MSAQGKNSTHTSHVHKKYGKEAQMREGEPESTPLSTVEQNFIQKVSGKFLYLGRAIDSTLLAPLSAIASQQTAPTKHTMQHTKQLLDYIIASQEDAVLTYHTSEMVLAAHSDVGYQTEPVARSRAGGHFYMFNNAEVPPNNDSIHNVAQIMKAVMSSASSRS